MFEFVLAAVRKDLDQFADDPDLIEVFDYLVNKGLGENTYVDDFLDSTSIFVDSKKRKLRLAAFGVTNTIPPRCPWTQGAVLKRAYRKKPSFGYCPSPEADWKSANYLDSLEDLLRFSMYSVKSKCWLWYHIRGRNFSPTSIARRQTHFMPDKNKRRHLPI